VDAPYQVALAVRAQVVILRKTPARFRLKNDATGQGRNMRWHERRREDQNGRPAAHPDRERKQADQTYDPDAVELKCDYPAMLCVYQHLVPAATLCAAHKAAIVGKTVAGSLKLYFYAFCREKFSLDGRDHKLPLSPLL
jgi:hypothetical protein